MSNHKFDQYLRQQLAEHPSELDTEAFWTTVAPTPDPSPSIVPWVWSILLGLCVVSFYQKPEGSKQEEAPGIALPETEASVERDNRVTPDQLAIAGEQLVSTPPPIKPSTRVPERKLVSPLPIARTGEVVGPVVLVDQIRPLAKLPSLAFSEVSALPTDTIPGPANDSLGADFSLKEVVEVNRWFSSVRLGVYATRRQLEPLSEFAPMEVTEWIEQRKIVETILAAWSVDLAVGYQHRKGSYYKAALGVSSIHERFDYTEPSSTDPNEVVARSSYNKITLIDLPVSIGKTFGYNRLRPFAEIGARFNIRQRVNGLRLDRGGFPYIMNDRLDFKKRLSYSLQASVGASWRWRTKLDLFANAQFRYYPDSYTQPHTQIRERYQWIGLQVGIRSYFPRTEEAEGVKSYGRSF